MSCLPFFPLKNQDKVELDYKTFLVWNTWYVHTCIHRRSRPEVFGKKGVIKKPTKFTGNYQCRKLSLNKVAGLRPATLLQKRLRHRCFPVNFEKFLGTLFFIEHIRWIIFKCFTPLAIFAKKFLHHHLTG